MERLENRVEAHGSNHPLFRSKLLLTELSQKAEIILEK